MIVFFARTKFSEQEDGDQDSVNKKELKTIQDKVFTSVEFWDDPFYTDINMAKQIFRGMHERKINLQAAFPNGIRIDCIDEELVQLMKTSGCARIAFEVESVEEDNISSIHNALIYRKLNCE